MQLFNNATPGQKFTGYKDTPKPGSAGGGVATPLFCPLSPIRAEWGPVDDAMLCTNGNEFNSLYGAETWNVRGKFFNHANLFAKMFQQKGIRHFMMRMELPGMARAMGRLSIEVVAYDVPQFERNADGTFSTDANGAKIPDATTPTVTGYKVRPRFDVSEGTMVKGDGAPSQGTLVGVPEADSTVYPIMDLEATHFGARGNRFNFNLYQPKDSAAIPVDSSSIESIGNMFYRLSVTETPVSGGTATPWYAVDGNDYMDFTFAEGAVNESDAQVSLSEKYDSTFTLTGQAYNGANIDGPCSAPYIYQANIETILGLLHASETAETVDTPAFIDSDNIHSVNLLGDTDHNGIPYRTIASASLAEMESSTYRPSDSSTFKLGGGNDGTMTDESFEDSVGVMCDTFGNGITLNDIKRYPFHFMFDSGYSLEIKKKLQSIMGKRPDVAVLCGTHVHGTTPKTVTDELATGSALAANFGLFAESTIYKTPATRGAIVPWAIRIASTDENSAWTHPTTLAYDIAGRMAEYWGSSDGVWVTDKAIDTRPNNIIAHNVLNYRKAADPVRESMWGNQMVSVEYSDVNELIYSGLQSIHPNDSSVLNSLVNVGAMIHTTWACVRANTHFVGRSMSAALLIQDSNELIKTYTAGIDKSKATVVPNTQITPEDNDLGYAWTTVADVSGNGMFTANTVTITSAFTEE